MNGSLETIEDRPALRLERHLDHSVERVWQAVTEPAELARWFVTPVHWKLELGETWEAMGQTGEIVELRAPQVLAWTWGEELFRFELQPDGNGCLLIFTHVFEQRALGAQHAAGWETYFNRLETHLGGGFLSAQEAHEALGELHERYAESFGLDPQVGRRTIAAQPKQPVSLEDGPKLRLERRYHHPVERVWRAITEPEELRHWFPPSEELQVTESEPPRLLAGSWYGDELRFELRPDGEGCVLVFTHAFTHREKAARDAAGWDRCFARFEALLADAPLSEADSLEAWPEIHERYAEQFGVDPELGRETFAQHTQR
jgi:uncharacterized protein YndB with AHSA1/START domain